VRIAWGDDPRCDAVTIFDPLQWDDFPTWSPDGQWILFERHWLRPSNIQTCGLFKVPLGGGAPVAMVAEKEAGCLGASRRR